MQNIKYMHTNLIARDWRSLADFYIEVFGCKPNYPERDLSGEWVNTMTLINGARIRGIHLSLPGYENGPTLEIFEYCPENMREKDLPINKQGFGHIAFHVDNVEEMLEKVLSHGGKRFSEVVRYNYPELGLLTMVYVRDPEGNFIELQNWKR